VMAVKAYHSPFGQTACLRRLWTEVAAGRGGGRAGFDAARDAFWTRVNARDGADATMVADILTATGWGTAPARPCWSCGSPPGRPCRRQPRADPMSVPGWRPPPLASAHVPA